MNLTQKIKQYAYSIGIDLIGITNTKSDQKNSRRLKKFIDQKRHGQMTYLENYQVRTEPQKLLPKAKSIIVIAINYYRESPPTPKNYGRIARYAYGRDYHKVLKKLLKQMVDFLQTSAPNEKHLLCVDSFPLLEKSYAQKAGLGFIGKNTTLITPQFGSFVLLGEIITTLKLDNDQPFEGTCGTCRRCLDACPTEALIAPYEMNANNCISYLTIEHKGSIPQKFHKKIGNLIFGCDICQEVCPYNKVYAKPLQLQAFKEIKIAGSELPLEEILNIKDDAEYLKRFAGSPLMRTKRAGLQRNARIALKNQAGVKNGRTSTTIQRKNNEKLP